MTKVSKTPPRTRRTASDVRVVLTTVPAGAAARISAALVNARVAACVNAVRGVGSVYRWKGRVERATETLLLIKTSRLALAACRRALARLHPYDVPEVVVVTPAAVEARYAAWVRASTR